MQNVARIQRTEISQGECHSHKCLYGEAAAAALIDAFLSGTGKNVPCRCEIALYLGEKFFYILLDNSFIELPESNLKIWEKQELI